MLNLHTCRDLALRTGIAEEELRYVAANITRYYGSRDEVVNGKHRRLYTAHPRLAHVLKAINRILQSVPLPPNMYGSRKGCRTRDAARPHVGRPAVGKIDIKSYFPRVAPPRVHTVFRHLGCTADMAGLLTRLCTADNHLPQGYSTSSSIANLVLVPTMQRMNGLAAATGLHLSNYLDDIVVSGDARVTPLHQTGLRILASSRLAANANKSRVFPQSARQVVVGHTVNSRLSVPRPYREDLAALLDRCRRLGPASQCGTMSLESFRKSVESKIAYVRSVRPSLARPLQRLFEQIIWPFPD